MSTVAPALEARRTPPGRLRALAGRAGNTAMLCDRPGPDRDRGRRAAPARRLGYSTKPEASALRMRMRLGMRLGMTVVRLAASARPLAGPAVPGQSESARR